jgi:hypothetical protein
MVNGMTFYRRIWSKAWELVKTKYSTFAYHLNHFHLSIIIYNLKDNSYIAEMDNKFKNQKNVTPLDMELVK